MLVSLCLLLVAFGAYRCAHNAAAAVPSSNVYKQRVVIKVHDVKPATDTLETKPYRDVLHGIYVENVLNNAKYARAETDTTPYQAPNRHLECFSRDRRPVVPVYSNKNGFFQAVHRAYGEHRSLVITPDMVWLTIVQGFSRHVNQNSEALRGHFVRHEGKKPLIVNMDGHIQLGNDQSDWEWAFRQFQDSIAANTNAEVASTVAGRFSGTDTDASVAFDIALMDAMQSYFSYWGTLSCGIPEIILEGTPADWQQVEERTARLAQYDLQWWISDLQPILAEFTRAAKGQPNRDFWVNIVRDLHDFGCGDPSETFLTGWIMRFFPYITTAGEWQRNPLIGLKTEQLYTVISKKQHSSSNNQPQGHYTMCTDKEKQVVHYIGPKVTLSDIPPGISEAILNMDDNGRLLKMELKAGFLGIRQDPGTHALRPVIGWVIVDTGEQPDQEAVEAYKKRR